MSNEPQLYKNSIKPLSVNMQMDWRNEMRIHLDDRYLDELNNIRQTESACYFCGFIDGKYMEVHHLSGDHSDWSKSNIVPCCTLCHRVNHLGWVGVKNHGSLGFIPNNVTTPSEEDSPSIALFNQLQRFYLLKDFYGHDDQEILKNISLFSSLENVVLNNKRIIMTKSYNAYLIKKELDKIKKRETAGLSADAIKEAEKEGVVGDEAVEEILNLDGDAIDNRVSINGTKSGKRRNAINLASGSLLDLVVSIGDTYKEHDGKEDENPALCFFKEQETTEYGKFVVLFNTTVFEPFEPYADYDFNERIRYYLSLDYFNLKKMGSILEKKVKR